MLRSNSFSRSAGEAVRDIRAPVAEKAAIPRLLFAGFRRCLYPAQPFQSDSERRFAVLLEDDSDVCKWFKPEPGQFRIYYRGDRLYDLDFVVETAAATYLREVKRADQLRDDEVRAKARAAVQSTAHATGHELAYGGTRRSSLLIPHDAIDAARTLHGLAAAYTERESVE